MKRVAEIVRDLEVRDLLAIARKVARKHYVTLPELLGRSHGSAESRARHELWYLLYDQIPSFPKLGEIFDRNHSTILIAVHRYRQRHPEGGEGLVVACPPDPLGPAIAKCEEPATPTSDGQRRAS